MKSRNEAMRKRVKDFVRCLDVTITKFCRRVQIAQCTYYRWINNKLDLSDKTLDRIEHHILHYKF